MGYIIEPEEIEEHWNRMGSTILDDNLIYEQLMANIQTFQDNDKLSGNSWNNLKMHMEAYTTVIKGMICANEIQKDANEKLRNAVNGEYYNEDEIRADIEDTIRSIEICTASIENYRESMNSLYIGMTPGSMALINYCKHKISSLEDEIEAYTLLIRKLNNKLEKLSDIVQSTEGIYDKAINIYEQVAKGIIYIKGNWQGGSYGVIADTSWMQIINEEWNQWQEDELAERLQDMMDNECLSYEKFSRLSREEQADYLNKIAGLVYTIAPDIHLTTGQHIEIPIGPDMIFKYSVDGSIGVENSGAWSIELKDIISEQKKSIGKFSSGNATVEVGNRIALDYGFREEYYIDDYNTMASEVSLEPNKASVVAKWEASTKYEGNSVSSTMGIEKKLNRSKGWKVDVAPSEEEEKSSSRGFNLERYLSVSPATGDPGILPEWLYNIFDK